MGSSLRYLTRRSWLALTASGVLMGSSPLKAAGEDNTEAAIGTVEDIVNVAWATPEGGAREEIEHEDPAFFLEKIETEDESALVITFLDGSKLTMGEKSEVVIDEFVYDATAKTGIQIITMTKGAFRYLSGQLPKESVKLQTPTVSLGIRGTELTFDVNDDGETESSALAGEAVYVSRLSQKELVVKAGESCLIGPDGKWRGGVRKFIHLARSLAILEGLEGARKRWRIRKERRRRAVRRLRRRLRNGGGPNRPGLRDRIRANLRDRRDGPR